MKITEQSKTRLAFAIGIPFFNGTQCDFDRNTDRAKIKRVMLFWPLKTIDVPLGDISSVRVAVSTGSAGESGSYSKSYPEVLLKSGRRVAMAAFGESSSKRAVAAMDAFFQSYRAPSI